MYFLRFIKSFSIVNWLQNEITSFVFKYGYLKNRNIKIIMQHPEIVLSETVFRDDSKNQL